MLANRGRISLEGVAHTIRIEHETEHACSAQKRRRFLGGRRSREARKSAEFRRRRRGRRDRPRSRACGENDVAGSGSLRMNTSGEEKWKSAGKRTAWLRPFLKSLAVLRHWHSRKTRIQHRDLYHDISQVFENKWKCDPHIRKSTWLSGG